MKDDGKRTKRDASINRCRPVIINVLRIVIPVRDGEDGAGEGEHSVEKEERNSDPEGSVTERGESSEERRGSVRPDWNKVARDGRRSSFQSAEHMCVIQRKGGSSLIS